MTTTFNVMRMSLDRWRIIAAVLLAAAVLAGCGTLTLRLSYNQGPRLLYWWLDAYVDLSDAQAPAARDAIGRWFGRHRATQLPEYADLLARLQAQALQPTTPRALCALWHEVRRHGDAALDSGLPSITAFVRSLEPGQLDNIERRFAKVNREFRAEHLEPEPAQRRRAALKRARERAEMLYGSLEPAQREQLAQAVAASPFDAQRWGAERLRRQEDILRTLRGLLAEPAMPPAQAQAELGALARRLQVSPRDEHRAYQERLTAYNCAVAAALHNTATARQREHARQRLRTWEEDLRELSGATAGQEAAPASGTVTRRGLTAGVGKSFSAASNIAAMTVVSPAL
jgi:hypothetical protein